MKNLSYALWAYSILLLVGGLIGFIKAGSLVSLAVSAPLAVWLMVCAYGLQKSCAISYLASVGTLIILMAFFSYRYFLTQHFMPSGMMALVTVLFLGYLYAYKKKETAQGCPN